MDLNQIWETMVPYLLDRLKTDKKIAFQLVKYLLSNQERYSRLESQLDAHFLALTSELYRFGECVKWGYQLNLRLPDLAKKLKSNVIIVGQAKRYATKVDFQVFDQLLPERFDLSDWSLFFRDCQNKQQLLSVLRTYQSDQQFKLIISQNIDPLLTEINFEYISGLLDS